MNPLAVIGYLVFAGIGLLIYAVLWAYPPTRPFMIGLHAFAGAVLVLFVAVAVVGARRRESEAPAADDSGERPDARGIDDNAPASMRVDVLVHESQPYPHPGRSMTPNYRVRVTAVNNTDGHAELDASNFSVVDGDGEAYFDLGWLADLPDHLLADDVVALQSGESAGGWLYFEVPDPGRVARFEYDPSNLSMDMVSTRLGDSRTGG